MAKSVKDDAKKAKSVGKAVPKDEVLDKKDTLKKADKVVSKKSKADAKAAESLTKKARSGNPAKRGEVISAIRDKAPAAVKVTKLDINAPWLVPTMVGLMALGIAWVVIFYLTASIGGYPLPPIGYWNLVTGFSFIIIGFGFSTKWK